MTDYARELSMNDALRLYFDANGFGPDGGYPDAWVDLLQRTGTRTGDRAWPMPLYEDYSEQLRSEIADLLNTGGRPAGACTAAHCRCRRSCRASARPTHRRPRMRREKQSCVRCPPQTR